MWAPPSTEQVPGHGASRQVHWPPEQVLRAGGHRMRAGPQAWPPPRRQADRGLAQACLPPHIDWSPLAPARTATGLCPGPQVGADPQHLATAPRAGPGSRGRGPGPTSWCSLWSSQSLERRWPHCTCRSTQTRECSPCGRCRPEPSLQRQAGRVAGARLSAERAWGGAWPPAHHGPALEGSSDPGAKGRLRGSVRHP